MLFIKNKNNTLVLIDDQDNSFTINPAHPHYDEILTKGQAEDRSVFELCRPAFVQKQPVLPAAPHDPHAAVTETSVTFNNVEFTDPCLVEIVNRLGGIRTDAVRRFLNRLTLNPNPKSVQMLLRFLQHHHLPLTEDGHFLSYKAVTHDYFDKYTGTLDNTPGKFVEIPRNEVEYDPNKGCSHGLHSGTWEYAAEYAVGDDRLVLIKTDPFHVVSVPHDSNHQKLRQSKYFVYGDYDKQPLDNMLIYTAEGESLTWFDYLSDMRKNVEQHAFKLKFNQSARISSDDTGYCNYPEDDDDEYEEDDDEDDDYWDDDDDDDDDDWLDDDDWEADDDGDDDKDD
jgi:hypothetical protein